MQTPHRDPAVTADWNLAQVPPPPRRSISVSWLAV